MAGVVIARAVVLTGELVRRVLAVDAVLRDEVLPLDGGVALQVGDERCANRAQSASLGAESV